MQRQPNPYPLTTSNTTPSRSGLGSTPDPIACLRVLCDLCGELPFFCLSTQSPAFLPVFSVFSVTPW